MHDKTLHTCANCGHRWLDRHHAYYAELAEWIQHSDVVEHELRCQLAEARVRIEQLRELVNWLPDPVADLPEIEDEGVPY
ncbi:MAG: hypothetical protein ACRET7_12590 [Burkholderiales bacterium]